jgi:uncharacterized protein (DUF1697 family)
VRYVAFLRGINLGKNRRVRKEALCAAFEDAGMEEVSTFRASGNVIFSAGRESEAKLTARIEEALAAALGYDVRTYLRNDQELQAIAQSRPFPADAVEASNGKLQVDILPKRPAPDARKKVLALATDQDLLAFGDRELFWLPSGGLLESSLDLKTIDKLIGPATRRTMGTIEQIAAKHLAG